MSDLNKNITTQGGIKLKTNGKLCTSDINVIPNLQEKTTVVNGDIVADSGYCGLKKVSINVPSGVTYEELNNELWGSSL